MLVSSIFLKLSVVCMERILVLRSLLLHVHTEYSCTHITTDFKCKIMDWEGYCGLIAFMWMNYSMDNILN